MSKQKNSTLRILKTPWTTEQVESLNLYQKSGLMHPYTCGNNRKDKNHLDSKGTLIATENGWICPYCDYKQDWASEALIRILDSLQDWDLSF